MAADFSKEELYARLAKAIDSLGDVEYAIGGAESMTANGYERSTRDIDVFVTVEDQRRLLMALRDAGLKIESIDESSHYVARLPKDPDFDRRIDVLTPAGDPELSAIREAVEIEHMGRCWRFFTADYVAAAKFVAYDFGNDSKHVADILAMYRRLIFNVKAVREMLTWLPEVDIKKFDDIITSYHEKETKRKKFITQFFKKPQKKDGESS